MLCIAHIVISLDQTLEIKQVETHLLLKNLKIEKRKEKKKRSYKVMWGLT